MAEWRIALFYQKNPTEIKLSWFVILHHAYLTYHENTKSIEFHVLIFGGVYFQGKSEIKDYMGVDSEGSWLGA